MRIFSFLITLLLTIGFVQAKPKKCNKSKEQTSIVKPIILQDLSTNIHPADDFFEYVNAKWIQNNPIPSDKTSWGAFDLLQEKSTTAVKKIIDHATKSKAPKGSNLQILGDFFKSGMDTNAINKAGITPLLPYIEIINNAKDKQSIGKMLGLLQVRDINTPFGFYISQDAKNSEKIYHLYYTKWLGHAR
jgi:putative endopeptidase